MKLERNLAVNETMTYYDAFIGDTLTANNLTVNVGVRYDDQKGFNAASGAPGNNSACDPSQAFSLSNPCIPALAFPGGPTELHYKDWEPRVGITYALGAQKSTLLRASYARFADQLGSGSVAYDNPVGYTYLTYPFTDANHNGLADPGELGANYFYTGIDPANPTSLTSPKKIASGIKNTKTDEFMFGIDHQILPELVAGVTYTHRHRSDFISTKYIGVDASDFVLDPSRSGLNAYDQQGNIIGKTGNYYDFIAPAGFNGGLILGNDPGYTMDYNGVELQLTKRLSNRWMMHGSVAYTDWKQKVNGANGCLGTVNTWKGPTNVLTTGGPSCGDGVQAFQESHGFGLEGRRVPELEVPVQHQRPVPVAAELQRRGQPVRPPGLPDPLLRVGLRRRRGRLPGLAQRHRRQQRRPPPEERLPARSAGGKGPSPVPEGGSDPVDRHVQRLEQRHRHPAGGAVAADEALRRGQCGCELPGQGQSRRGAGEPAGPPVWSSLELLTLLRYRFTPPGISPGGVFF